MESIRGDHTESSAKPGCKNGKFFHMNATRKFSFFKKNTCFFIKRQKRMYSSNMYGKSTPKLCIHSMHKSLNVRYYQGFRRFSTCICIWEIQWFFTKRGLVCYCDFVGRLCLLSYFCGELKNYINSLSFSSTRFLMNFM